MLRSRFATCASILAVSTLAVAAARPLFQDMQMPEPAEQHEMLQKTVGEYAGTVTMMMPGMPTDPARATESIKAFGGFWTTTNFESNFMGMPYAGHAQMGYDPGKGKFVGTWIDSMSSYLSIMEGEMNDKGALVMTWEAPDMTGKLAPHRSVTAWGEDSYKMEFFMGEGEGMKIMEIKMKRKPMEAGADK